MRFSIVPFVLLIAVVLAQRQACAAMGPTQAELDAAGESVEWLLPNHDYAGQRFVDLKQIKRDNAAQLRPICIYQAGDVRGFQPNPLVYKGLLYITTVTSTMAIDAATCVVRWRHDWRPKAKEAEVRFGGGVRNPFRSRGAALKDGMVVRSTSDGYLIALDAETGKELWERLVANAEKYELMIMAPLIYDDLVITGIGISEFGIKGWIGGFRLADGEPVWRFNTVPDEGQPGAETWNGGEDKPRGGGGIWVTPSLDTATGSLYVAVGNPAPDFFGGVRMGKNLYTAAMIVLDAKTGELQWFRQVVPHDLHDWDLTITNPLYSAVIAGTRRSLVSVAGKDGILRAVDRESHEQIYEVPLTTLSNADAEPTIEGAHTCPGVLGGFEWSSPSYNPTSNTLVAPTVDWCGVFRKADELLCLGTALYGGILHLRSRRGVPRLVDRRECVDRRHRMEISIQAPHARVSDNNIRQPRVYRGTDGRLCGLGRRSRRRSIPFQHRRCCYGGGHHLFGGRKAICRGHIRCSSGVLEDSSRIIHTDYFRIAVKGCRSRYEMADSAFVM
jgi:alcohol dehydrogenase (cytochrome c)